MGWHQQLDLVHLTRPDLRHKGVYSCLRSSHSQHRRSAVADRDFIRLVFSSFFRHLPLEHTSSSRLIATPRRLDPAHTPSQACS